VPIVLKSGNLNLLEPSGPVQACKGIALSLPYYFLLVPVIAVEVVSLGVISTVQRLILIFRISDYVRTLNNILKIQFLLPKPSSLLERPVG
jgi:hypothetical protein